MLRQTGRSYRFCDGYSLLELMIVLAILVSVMAVAWPNISRRMQLIGPQEAALQLKADLAEAREQSVVSGEAWLMRIERGGSNYEMGPVAEFRETAQQSSMGALGLEEAFDSAISPEASLSQTGSGLDVAPTLSRIRQTELPAGIVFDDGFAHRASEANAVRTTDIQQAAIQLPPTQPATLPNANVLSPLTSTALSPIDNWKSAVIFQPDGRATESEIRLKELVSENKIRLRIRGFTGGVTIDKLERKQRVAIENNDPLKRELEGNFPQQPPQDLSQFPASPVATPLDSEGLQ